MKTNNIFEQNPKKTIIIITFSALLIIDITAANLYKIYFGTFFYKKEPLIEKTYRVASDIYDHDLARNIYLENAIWGYKKYTVATDSLGFKSENPKNTPMASKKFRIVFIGDSFTEGIGIRYQDTFVGRIADFLLERNIEVLNAAVASYSPIIYYRKIKYFLDRRLKFNELIVFIDISDIQDEAIYYKMSPNNTVQNNIGEIEAKENRNEWNKASMSKKIWITIQRNSIVTYSIVKKIKGSIKKIKDFIKDPIFDRNAKNKDPRFQRLNNERNIFQILLYKRSMWTIDESIFKEYEDKGLKKSEFYMNQLYHLLKQNNIALTIAVYPWPTQIVNNDLNSIQVKYWRKWAQQKKVNFLNYFPCFINQPLQKQASGFDTLKKYFIDGDAHWNEKGHQLIASEFISFYSRQNGKCVGHL